MIADAANNGRKIPDRLAPLDDSKATYLVFWEFSVTGDHTMSDEMEMEAVGELDGAGVSALTGDGGALNFNALTVPGLSSTLELGSDLLPGGAPEGNGQRKKGKGKGKTKGGAADADPNAAPAPVEPETPLKKAQRLCKLVIKTANDARSSSVQLKSLGISEVLSGDLRDYSEYMETLYQSVQLLVKDGVDDEDSYSEFFATYEAQSFWYEEADQMAKASLNVSARISRRRAEAAAGSGADDGAECVSAGA